MIQDKEFQSRNPIAQQALDEIKSERVWESVDAARMGGRGGTIIDFRDLDFLSDREIINKYLEQEQLREAYQNEHR